ncbi:MAG: hypothetical protein AAFP02_09190, partial [Bacteroidota bacterium]
MDRPRSGGGDDNEAMAAFFGLDLWFFSSKEKNASNIIQEPFSKHNSIPMYTTRKLWLMLPLLLASFSLSAQNTDVLLQGFNWESENNPNGWYNISGIALDDIVPTIGIIFRFPI